jgi:hypothetical protein
MLPSPEQYVAMLDGAAAGRYAFPAINVTSSQTLNAAMRGFADAGSDGIVQVTVGGARYFSGAAKDAHGGARAFAALARELATRQPVAIALHTDHCPPGDADAFLRPLLTDSRARVEHGERDRLYTTPEELLQVAGALGTGNHGRYLLAATFGNVHGIYAPGHVKLRPEILADGQRALEQSYPGARFQYADRLSDGKLRTYFGDRQALRRQAEQDGVSPDAVDAAGRIRDRLGFSGEGERGMYLCHSFRELGGTPLGSVLDDIRDFLVSHPHDVLVIINQDYVTPQDPPSGTPTSRTWSIGGPRAVLGPPCAR